VRAIALVGLAGCASVFGVGDPEPLAPCMVGTFDMCAHRRPDGPIDYPAGKDAFLYTTLDCTDVIYDPTDLSICVIYGTDITIDGNVTATGARPIAFVASGTITVSGTVDASGHKRNGLTGPGTPASECSAPTDVAFDQNGASGAAGGSFIGKGGAGGKGTDAMSAPGQPGAPQPEITKPRGGCSGGAGGGAFGPAGGGGGGAVLLVAGESVTIEASGRVLAAGAGGEGAPMSMGIGPHSGAGGGSGGYLLIGAPRVAVMGTLNANGGGGGEGDDGMTGGADGHDGFETAAGGSGKSSRGGDGGGGGTAERPDGQVGTAAVGGGGGGITAGGGGGGGGVGIIFLPAGADTTSATISPAATAK
jgi:hypothetical protein